MQGSLLRNLGDGTPTGKGIPTVATFNAMGYDVATFGNHEFDWGQANLANRTTEATYPVRHREHRQERHGQLRHGRLDEAGLRRRAVQVLTVGTAPNAVKVAFIGVTTTGDADHHGRRRRRPVSASRTLPTRSSTTTTR